MITAFYMFVMELKNRRVDGPWFFLAWFELVYTLILVGVLRT